MAILITTYGELDTALHVTEWLGEKFELLNDIDASDSLTAGGEIPTDPGVFYGWVPVGTVATPFTGQFHGNGFTISNLHIKRSDDEETPGAEACGFFGAVEQDDEVGVMTINNLTLADADIEGVDNVGVLIGMLTGETKVSTIVTDCHATGTAVATGVSATDGAGTGGGLIGVASTATISNCSADCGVTASDGAGGFVATATDVAFADCFASGDVESTGGSSPLGGGFVAHDIGIDNTYAGCHASGDVDTGISGFTPAKTGGFVALNTGGVYSRCYATGNVVCTDEGDVHAGGFTGLSYGGSASLCWASGNVEANAADGTARVGGFVGAVEEVPE